jgi:hypothetical protein
MNSRKGNIKKENVERNVKKARRKSSYGSAAKAVILSAIWIRIYLTYMNGLKKTKNQIISKQ